jgi:hypothetical protein
MQPGGDFSKPRSALNLVTLGSFGKAVAIMKTVVLAAALTVVVFLGGACWVLWPRPNYLVVINQSNQAISVLTVKVGGETTQFDNLPAGMRVSAPFRIIGDDHYELRGQLADGTVIATDCGYVTNGMDDVQATFVIGPDGRVQCDEQRGQQRRP